MIVERLLENCPEAVSEVLAELQKESSTESVWLIGSRANQSSTSESDWDLLVFSSVGPEFRPSARRSNVDVIRVGPTRRFLLEGGPDAFTYSFEDWLWAPLNEISATYVGRKYCDYDGMTERNTGERVFLRPQGSAYLIWSNAALKEPTLS